MTLPNILTRQQAVFYSLMNNFDEARNAMTAMANSEGELQKANDVYLDTIGAHVQQLKNAFDTLFYNDGTVEFINAIVDLGTGLLKILNLVVDVADAFGGWKVVIPVITAIAGANFLKRFLADGQTLIGVFQRIPAVISSFTSGTALATQGTSNFSAALTGLGITASATQVALAGVALAAGAAFLIYNSVKRAEEERREAAREAAKSYNEEAQSLENYKKKAEELHGVLDSGTASEKEAYDARKELISMQESLIEEYGKEAEAIDLVTQSVDSQTEAIANLSKAKWTDFYTENAPVINKAKDDLMSYDHNGILDVYFPRFDLIPKEYAEEFYSVLEDELSRYGFGDILEKANFTSQSGLATVDFGVNNAYEILDIYKTLSSVMSDVGMKVLKTGDLYDRVMSGTMSGYSRLMSDVEALISEEGYYFETYVEGLLQFNDEYKSVWSSIVAANEKYNEAFAKDDKGGMASAISDMLNAQEVWQNAGWDDEAVNLFVSRYLDDFFGKTHNVSLKLDVETAIENGDEIATQIEDAINYFSDENGEVNLFKVLNMEWDEAESNEAMSAYSKLTEAAEQFGYVAEDGTADLTSFLSVLAELGYIKFSGLEEASKHISSFSESINKITKLSKGGNVQLLLRPEISTEAFERAGWDTSNGIEDMFIQTFTGVNDSGETIAMNFSPVLLDEYGKPTGKVMSYRALRKYAQDVISGVRKDDLKLIIGSEFKGDEAESEARKTKIELQDELSNLVINYDLDKYAPLIEGLDSIKRSASNANEAVDRLNKALSGQDYDDNMEARADAFAKMMELASNGKYGSTEFKAYTDFFGISSLDGVEAKLTWMEEHASLFGVTLGEDGKYVADAEAGMLKFLSVIDAATESGEELSKWIRYDSETDDFWFDPTKLPDIADYFNTTEESITDLIGMVRTFYDVWEVFDPETIGNWVTESGLLTQATQDGEAAAVMYTGKIREMLEAFGFTNDEIDEAIDSIKEFSQVPSDKIIELDFEFDENTTNEEMKAAMDGVLAQLDSLDDDVKIKAAHLAEALSFTNKEFAIDFVANLEDSELQEEVNAIINDKSFEYSASSDETSISTLEEIVAKVDGKTYTFTVNISNEEDLRSFLSELRTFDGGVSAVSTATENEYDITWKLDESSNQEAETVLTSLFEDREMKVEFDSTSVEQSASKPIEVVDNVIESVNGAQTSVEQLTEKTDNFANTDYDVSNITSGNKDIADSAEDASTNTDNATESSNKFSSTSVDVGSKVVNLGLFASVAGGVRSILDDIISRIRTWNSTKIEDKTMTMTTNYVTNGSPVRNAKGTSHAKAGLSLLGDEYNAAGEPRPELVLTKDGAYVAGVNGPVFSKLNEGDIVYPYKETKKILANSNFSGSLKDSIPRFEGGTGPNSSGINKVEEKHGTTVGTYNDNSTNTYNYNAGDDTTTTTKEDDESWFEKQYRLHNHLVNMEKEDQETYFAWLAEAWPKALEEGKITEAEAFKYEEEVFQGLKNKESWFDKEYKSHNHLLKMEKESEKDYLDWLKKAYKKAYKEGLISEDDYNKYQEEVFNTRRDIFKDYLSDSEFEIERKERLGNQHKQVISDYKKLIKDVKKELKKAYKSGLTQNDSYVQELLKKLWGYRDSVKNVLKEVKDNAKSALDKLVDYEIKVIKQQLDDSKSVLQNRIDAIKAVVDKAKKDLQDAADEEKYLEEQGEKRKSVSDIKNQLAQLEYDNSAWAQKRKKELQSELADAEKS